MIEIINAIHACKTMEELDKERLNIINYIDIFSQGMTFQYNMNRDFINALYFSITTFTSVGYGDITPTGISILLSGIEMFLGVTMVGIWTATLARKIIR